MKNVYAFVGEEELLKEKALKELRSSALANNDSINFDIFYCQNTPAQEALGLARTLPYFSQKRMVVLKDADKFSQDDAQLLVNYIKNPANTTVLVVLTDDEGFIKKYIRPLGDLVEVKIFRHPDRVELDDWIKKEFAKSKKTVTAQAMHILKENVGNDLAILSNEIEKLVVYAQGRDNIETSDVEELVGASQTKTGFELVDAISRKQAHKAVFILENLLENNKTSGEIIGVLAWYLRRLHKAKELISLNVPNSVISERLKVPHWILDDFIRQVKSVSLDEINKNLGLLLECDLSIKTGKAKEEQAVEFLIAQLMR